MVQPTQTTSPDQPIVGLGIGVEPTHLPNCLSEFISASYPPQDDKPVLCIRFAMMPSLNASKYELITACYIADKRGWRDIQGRILNGQPILGWKNAHRWLQPNS